MTYEFTRERQSFGRHIFALTLDRKTMTERIVIGETSEVRRRLERGTGEVFYDETRPLGELLFHFEADPDRTWNVNAMLLHGSYGKLHPGRGVKWKAVKPGADFLREKYESGEPAALFAAIRTWDEYLNCYNMNHGPQLFIDRTALLYRPFFLYGEYRPWKEEAQKALARALHEGESQVELWYPILGRRLECVVTASSFQPVIFYYLQRIQEWGLHFLECSACGKDFLAPTFRYAYCSDACRKVKMAQAKQEFDQRAKGDKLEQLDEAAYNYWYNHLRRLRRKKTADPERLAAVQAGLKAFRAEAIRMKKEVKQGDLPLSDFTSWLTAQYDEADRLAKDGES